MSTIRVKRVVALIVYAICMTYGIVTVISDLRTKTAFDASPGCSDESLVDNPTPDACESRPASIVSMWHRRKGSFNANVEVNGKVLPTAGISYAFYDRLGERESFSATIWRGKIVVLSDSTESIQTQDNPDARFAAHGTLFAVLAFVGSVLLTVIRRGLPPNDIVS